MSMIKIKTIKGKDIIVDIDNRTLTIQQDSFAFAYEGPYVMHFEGRLVNYLEIKMDGKNVRVAISTDIGSEIVKLQHQADQAALEAAIPGITLLSAAYSAETAYLDAFNRMMESEDNDGVNPPTAPAQNTAELSKLYPRAALYIKADGYSNARNFAKSNAGNKAKRILLSGGSDAEALSILENWLDDTIID